MARVMERQERRAAMRAMEAQQAGPIYQAYQILHWGFTIAPIIAGLDKFFNLLATEEGGWAHYLAPVFPRLLGISAQAFMSVVGVVEIVAGLLVAFRPRIGAYIVGAWLLGIILNLLILGEYFDIALRDLGLALGAFALGRLAMVFDRR
jgi:hypothetical protein